MPLRTSFACRLLNGFSRPRLARREQYYDSLEHSGQWWILERAKTSIQENSITYWLTVKFLELSLLITKGWHWQSPNYPLRNPGQRACVLWLRLFPWSSVGSKSVPRWNLETFLPSLVMQPTTLWPKSTVLHQAQLTVVTSIASRGHSTEVLNAIGG